MPASSSTNGAIVVVGSVGIGNEVLVGAVASAVTSISLSALVFAGGGTVVVVVVDVDVVVEEELVTPVGETRAFKVASGQFNPLPIPLEGRLGHLFSSSCELNVASPSLPLDWGLMLVVEEVLDVPVAG
ncbi:MAG: hypothetical protein WC864_11095 [Ilumatobacteraceae bacterium]